MNRLLAAFFAWSLIAVMWIGAIQASPPQQQADTQPCTFIERREINTLLIENDLAFAEIAAMTLDIETPADLTAQVIAYDNAITTYETEVQPELPVCADGWYLGEFTALRYRQTLLATLLLTLMDYRAYLNSAESIGILADSFRRQLELSGNLREESGQLLNESFLEGETPFPQGIPQCDASQRDDLIALESLHNIFETYMPQIKANLRADDMIMADTAFDMESIAALAMMHEVALCEDVLVRHFADSRLYLDTAILAYMDQLLHDERDHGNHAAALAALTMQRHDELRAVLGIEAQPTLGDGQ